MTIQPTPALTRDRPLAGRAAIVTGSTSGIGLGIARALAHAGADIVLNGLGDPVEIEQLRSDIEGAADVRIIYDAANLMDPAGAVAMVEHAADMFGQVDILVNNAGIQHVSPIMPCLAAT